MARATDPSVRVAVIRRRALCRAAARSILIAVTALAPLGAGPAVAATPDEQLAEAGLKDAEREAAEARLVALESQLLAARDSLQTAEDYVRSAQQYLQKVRQEERVTYQGFAEAQVMTRQSLRPVQELRRSLGGTAYFRETLAKYGMPLKDAGSLNEADLAAVDEKDRPQFYADLTGESIGSYEPALLLHELQSGYRQNVVPLAAALANLGGIGAKALPSPSHWVSGAFGFLVDVYLNKKASDLGLGGETPELANVDGLEAFSQQWEQRFGEISADAQAEAEALKVALDQLPKDGKWTSSGHNQQLRVFAEDSRALQESLEQMLRELEDARAQAVGYFQPVVDQAVEIVNRTRPVAETQRRLVRDLRAEIRQTQSQIAQLEREVHNLQARAYAGLESEAFTAQGGRTLIYRVGRVLRGDDLHTVGWSLLDDTMASLFGLPSGAVIDGIEVEQIQLVPKTERRARIEDGKETWEVRKFFEVHDVPTQVIEPHGVTAEPEGIVLARTHHVRVLDPGQATLTLRVTGVTNLFQILRERGGGGYEGRRLELEDYGRLAFGDLESKVTVNTSVFRDFRLVLNGTDEAAQAIDLFIAAGKPGGGRLTTQALWMSAQSWSGLSTERRSFDSPFAGRIEVDNPDEEQVLVQPTGDGTGYYLSATQPTSTQLTFRLIDGDDVTVAEQTVSVTFNVVTLKPRKARFSMGRDNGVIVPAHRPGIDPAIVFPADELITVDLDVTGPAPMYGYVCEWDWGVDNKSQSSQTGFRRESDGQWASQLKIRVLDGERGQWAGGGLTARIRPARDNGHAAGFSAFLFAAAPRIERLVLQGTRGLGAEATPADTTVRQTGFDLFYRGGDPSRLQLTATAVQTHGGTRSALAMGELKTEGDAAAFATTDGSVTPGATPGRLTLWKELKPAEDDRIFIAEGQQELISNRLTVTSNSMEVRATPTGYRAAVTGPADMGRYASAWGCGGETVEAPFASVGAQVWHSDIERPAFDCLTAQIRSTDGIVVADYVQHLPRPTTAPAGGGVRRGDLRLALVELFTAYENEDVDAFLQRVAPDFQSQDDGGSGYDAQQLRFALEEDFRSLEGIEFGVEADPPVRDAEQGLVYLSLRWSRRASLAVDGREWLLTGRASTLTLRMDAATADYQLTSVEGDPLFGLTLPTGDIVVPEDSRIEGVPVGQTLIVSDGSTSGGFDGGGGGGGGADFTQCTGSIPLNRWDLDDSFWLLFAGIDIDPYTGACGLRNDGQGQALILQSPPDGSDSAPGAQIGAFPDRLVNNWEFAPPSPLGGPGVSVEFTPGTEQMVWLRSTGPDVILRITFRVTGEGEELVLEVLDVTEIE